ncbi:MAG: hypothetical protein HW421_3894 [Ignavibacteria bacterium]|nr:hypothetical protein [Ignavibacteria bacterium]
MAQQEVFNPQSLTIKQLFNNADSFYQIPRYQRPYKWSDEEIEKFWDDITEACSNKTENYFLGSIITATPKEKSSYLDVVDGQQRITTLMILFAVVRDLYKNLNFTTNPDPSNITSKTIEYSIKADDKFNRLKLYTHISHHTDFEETIIEADTTLITKPKKRDIERDEQPKYKFLNTAAIFLEKLKSKSENYVGKLLNYLFNNVRIIRIDCTNTEFAIKLFQVINTRGLDLTNADLIKSFLMQKIEEEYKDDSDQLKKKEDQFMQDWVSIEQIIKNFDDDLDDFFIIYEYYLLGSNPKKSLYDELVKTEVFKNGKSLEIIKDFKKFVKNYEAFLWNADNPDLFALWYLPWKFYWKSILLTAYHIGYLNIPKLIMVLKRYYYIYWIAGKTLTAIKQTSFNLIKQVKNNMRIEEIEEFLKNDLDKIVPTTIDALNDDIYEKAWCKPLFCLLEYNATDASRLSWIPLTKDLHLEHIIPQKFGKFDEWNHINTNLFEEWGNSGANLTLLGGSKNIEASANPFKDKINVYKGKGLYENKNSKITGFNITQSIVADFDRKKYNFEWNEDAIRDRWEWFCNESAEVLKIDISQIIKFKKRKD